MSMWRKLRDSWPSAFGELLIIIIGVLVSLAIDQWNDDRVDRATERLAISRIRTDIQSDMEDFELRSRILDIKEDSLLRVRRALEIGSANDAEALLIDIIDSANFGWNQGLAHRSTFDDLLGSGNLRIIQDPDIRLQIAEYYRSSDDEHIRTEERETPYPDLTYRLVPRGRSGIGDSGDFTSEGQLESGLSERQLTELAARALESQLAEFVTAEINLGRFIQGVTVTLRSQALALSEQLEEYQASIQ